MNELFSRESLSAAQRDEMFALLAAHFEGVTRERFERDLAEKNWVVEIRRDGRLCGFSTMLVREAWHDGRAITAVYSGDTIVTPEARGSNALARAWIASVNQLCAGFGARPCYWLLLTSGFRTYRFLPVFWREFIPRHDARTPTDRQHLLTELARAQYGSSFEATAGLVRFAEPQRLRGHLNLVPPGREADAHVAFFLSRNPNHARGDELVCLTEICDANLTPAGRRMIGA
jgi:hypothetical protein